MKIVLRLLAALAVTVAAVPAMAQLQRMDSVIGPTPSAVLARIITEGATGSGSLVLGTDPTFVTKITTPRVLLNAGGSLGTPALGYGTSGLAFTASGGDLQFAIGGLDFGYVGGATSGDVSVPNEATNGTVSLGLNAGRYYRRSGAYNSGNVAVGPESGGAASPFGTNNKVYSSTFVGEKAGYSVGLGQKSTGVGSDVFLQATNLAQSTGLGRGACSGGGWFIYVVCTGHGAGYLDAYGAYNTYVGGNNTGAQYSASGAYAKVAATGNGSVMTVSTVYAGTVQVGQTYVPLDGTVFGSPIVITSLGTGSGGTGTYNYSGGEVFSSSAILVGAGGGSYKTAVGSGAGTQGLNDSNTNHIGADAKSSGSNMTVIGHGIDAATVSGRLASDFKYTSISNAAGVTYTAAQFMGGFIVRSGAAAVSDTLPTAAQIVAATPGAEAGKTGLVVRINNSNSSSLTLAAPGGGGITLSTSGVVLAADTIILGIFIDNVGSGTEAVRIIELGRQLYTTGSMQVGGNITTSNLILNASGVVQVASATRMALGTNREVSFFDSGVTGTFSALRLGAASSAPGGATIYGQPSSGSNAAGGDLTITAGLGTGTATPSTLNLSSPVAVASGSGAQTQTVGLKVNRGTYAGIGYTVAALPSSPLTGARAYVTDATACTFQGSLTGGGSTFCPAVYDGSAWKGG